MTEKVIEGVVKISEEDLSKLNTEGAAAVSDEVIEALAAKSGDTVEHIKEMLKLHETGELPPKKPEDVVTTDDKLLAGKYKTEGDLDQGIQSLIDKYGKEKAYKMLESSMGKDVTTGDDPAAKAAADAKIAADAKAKAAADALTAGDALSGDDAAAKAAADAAAKAGDGSSLDMEKYAKEFAENQKLSDASYEELAKVGLDKELVNGYIAGIDAQGELYTQKVYEKAGGLEKYDALVEWGSTNLTGPERVRFNDAMNSQDITKAGMVLEALTARYEKAEGSFKRQSVEIKDSIDGASTATGYLSSQEMQKDMRDPRYAAGDKAFHAHVKARIAASTAI